MGQPIRLHWRSKEIILDLADSLVQSDTLGDGVRAALSEAIERARPETSYDVNVLPLTTTIYRYGTEEDRFHLRQVSKFEEWDLGIKRFAPLNGASQGEPLNGDFTYSLLANYPLSEGATYGIASTRAGGVAEPLGHDPSDLMLYALEAFGSEESARAYMIDEGGVSAYDYVHTAIQGRIVDRLIGHFKTNAGRIRISPPPFTDRFREVLIQKLKAQKLEVTVESIESWERSPDWKPAIAAFFAELLVRGTGSEELTTFSFADRVRLRNRVEARKLRKEWYEHLSKQYSPSYLKEVVESHFSEGSREHVQSLAWLSHFDPGLNIGLDEGERAMAAEMLEDEILVFHRLAPGLEGEEFTELLTPFAGSMDLKGVANFLSHLPNGSDRSRKFNDMNIFGWHADNPANFARWLKERIELNKTYRTFEDFLSGMFDVRMVDFIAKRYRFEAQDVDTKPLIDAVNASFPNALEEYPELRSDEVERDHDRITRVEAPHREEAGAGDEESSAAGVADTSLKSGVQVVIPLIAAFKPVR